MKYKDEQGNWVSIALPSLDSMPVGTIVDYDGQTSDIPNGWQTYGTGQIKKVSQTTPTSAQIVDGYNTSTTDGYSSNYINQCNTYSTSEIDTGKIWIDGKPIYRKGFQFSFQGSSGENSFNTDISSISNFNSFVSLNFEALVGTNLYISQNFYGGNNNYLFVFYRNNKIEYRLDIGVSTALNGYAFIEYTKTTD